MLFPVYPVHFTMCIYYLYKNKIIFTYRKDVISHTCVLSKWVPYLLYWYNSIKSKEIKLHIRFTSQDKWLFYITLNSCAGSTGRIFLNKTYSFFTLPYLHTQTVGWLTALQVVGTQYLFDWSVDWLRTWICDHHYRPFEDLIQILLEFWPYMEA